MRWPRARPRRWLALRSARRAMSSKGPFWMEARKTRSAKLRVVKVAPGKRVILSNRTLVGEGLKGARSYNGWGLMIAVRGARTQRAQSAGGGRLPISLLQPRGNRTTPRSCAEGRRDCKVVAPASATGFLGRV